MAQIDIGVDWTTVLLQALNFLLLLVILQRFLYRPLRRKMQEREAAIESEISEARQRAEAAEREREELEQRLEETREEAATIRREAREDAAEKRAEILERAREEAAEIRREANERIQREEEVARERIQKRARRTAVELAEDMLRETGGEALHDQLVDRFLSGRGDLEDADLDRLAAAIRRADGAIRVRSAYPLDERTQRRLRETLGDRLPWTDESPRPEFDLSVEEDPELVAGITLISGGIALDLNVRHTLDEVAGETTTGGRTHGDERRGVSSGEGDDGGREWAQKSQENGGEAGR